jgi:hypothetical protein
VKAFVDWLLAQRPRLVIVAVVAAPLLPVVSAALIALETARRGVRPGLVSAVAAVAGLCVLAVLSRTDLAMFATIGTVTMGSGLVVGALLRRVGNLSFAFQIVLLLCFVAVLAFGLIGPDPQVLFGPVLREFEVVLRAPDYTEAEVAQVTAQLALLMPAVTVFSSLVGTLLLGYWWWSLATGEPRFAAEFRQLKLGRWLGAAATVIVALGLVFSAALVQNLTPLAWLGFLLQGLAVVHAWAHVRRWHPGLLVLLYLVLVLPPLTVLVMLPLSIVGLVDNWLNLRTQLRSEA